MKRNGEGEREGERGKDESGGDGREGEGQGGAWLGGVVKLSFNFSKNLGGAG